MRRGVTLALVVTSIALAGCDAGQGGPVAEEQPASLATEEPWQDDHGNTCVTLRPGLAKCRTPDGHLWYREDIPSAKSLARDPVKALMWIFSRVRDETVGTPGDHPTPGEE